MLFIDEAINNLDFCPTTLHLTDMPMITLNAQDPRVWKTTIDDTMIMTSVQSLIYQVIHHCLSQFSEIVKGSGIKYGWRVLRNLG